MKRILLLLSLVTSMAYGQVTNTTPTNFTNSLEASRILNLPALVATPPVGIKTGGLSYNTTLAKLASWNGTAWIYYLTELNAQNTYAPLTRSLTINGVSQDLSLDRTWTITTDLSDYYTKSQSDSRYKSISYVPSWTEITGKPTFATVSTTGSYNDLINKPTIPSQFNPIAGTNITLSGTYPNITFNASSSGSGTVTSFSKTDGFGITSSVTNPTTTPNHSISVDTTKVRTVDNSFNKSQTNTALSLKSNKANFINIVDLGGIGNGVTDNTTVINNALSTYKEIYFPEGDYLVTSLSNVLGAKITGSGRILKSISGGSQQLNTGTDFYNNIFGQEYLSFFQNKLLTRFDQSTGLKIIWSGDSTTAGDGTTSGYTLSELFDYLCANNSISNIRSINAGHSSAYTEQWRTTYLPSDMSANPDLYIIRWGINDPGYLKNGNTAPLDAGDNYPNRRDILDFEISLRAGLTVLRAAKSQAQQSILLMSPNTVSDTPNGRDEKWLEQVRKVYMRAARDFQCAYIDTYSLWNDSRNGAATLYMDNPFGDGRAIHPYNIFNTWITSKVFDLVFPKTLYDKVRDGNIVNQSSIERVPSKSDGVFSYAKGMSLHRTLIQAPYSFPADGTLMTFLNSDKTGGQFVFDRLSGSNPNIFYRSIVGQDSPTPIPYTFGTTVKLWHNLNLRSNGATDTVINNSISNNNAIYPVNSGGEVLQSTMARGNSSNILLNLLSVSNTSNSLINKVSFTPVGFPTEAASIRSYFSGANWFSGSKITFYTNPGPDITSNSSIERMVIDPNGNIGIKNTSPIEALDVTGKIRASVAPTNPTDVVRLLDLGNYVDRTTTQNINGTKTFNGLIVADNGTGFRVYNGSTLITELTTSTDAPYTLGTLALHSYNTSTTVNQTQGIIANNNAPAGAYSSVKMPANGGGTLAKLEDLSQYISVPAATTSVALAGNSTYGFHATTLTTATLPATNPAEGTLITLIGIGSGQFRISQNASQYIVSGNATTTVGTAGYIQTTTNNTTITIRYLDTNRWQVTSSNSAPTIN